MKRYKIRIAEWISDKKNWLMTFNKRPSVIINQDLTAYKGGGRAVEIRGRVDVIVNGDVRLVGRKSELDDYFSIEDAVTSAYVAGYEDAKCNLVS